MDTMDTSSDSDGARSPGAVYGLQAYGATARGGYGGDRPPTALPPVSRKSSPSSPPRLLLHSESSGSGSVDEPSCAAKGGHHKFSIDRILGRFGGDVAAAVVDASSCAAAETSDSPDAGCKSHGNDSALRGAGEHNDIITRRSEELTTSGRARVGRHRKTARKRTRLLRP